MKRIELAHPDVFLIEPQVWNDGRGWLFESFHAEKHAALGVVGPFLQDNHSYSRRGVLRGLHLQVAQPQAKFVRAVSGTVLDVAVDVRPSSPRFGQSVSAILSAENKHQIYVPRGFAHGFLALSDEAELHYKCDALYAPGDEQGIAWNDEDLNIDWFSAAREWNISPDEFILSDKDQLNPPLREIAPEKLPR
ncbi:MAG TPA: dTDP-4-dehydrorhamnose 3,5-epimerase [Abditibacteriaceae bacterium]|jgi:dTDP-4-dehydrorhamnose 3,5-epimerase